MSVMYSLAVRPAGDLAVMRAVDVGTAGEPFGKSGLGRRGTRQCVHNTGVTEDRRDGSG